MIAYPIGASGQTLIFSDQVLRHFERHRQVNRSHNEAGGQIFARINGNEINVIDATGPRLTDRRTRTSFVPDRYAEQVEIDERFVRGLHFVGDWHTHPEDQPSPSAIDLRSTAEGVRLSKHCLNAFVLVIVGRSRFPYGLHISLHDGSAQYLLTPNAWGAR
ncbi:Mov34/MPN/PAD-1 family protein [Methylobacterium sp. Gmos1]